MDLDQVFPPRIQVAMVSILATHRVPARFKLNTAEAYR
jgi:hypothetical protein